MSYQPPYQGGYQQPSPQQGYGGYPPPHSPQPPYQQQPPPNQYGAPPPQPGYQQPPYGAPPPGQNLQPGYPPQQGYGAPPSPYPPHQYQGSPSPQPYGAPQQQYGAPAPQYPPASPQPYGAPVPQYPPNSPQPYGAPPPQGYGGPPPGQFGAPPPGQYAAQPTLGYGPMPSPQQAGYDGVADAQILYKAMKGFGTDEKALSRTLANKDPVQIDILKQRFNAQYHKDLIAYIKSEVSGFFEEGLVALCLGPLDHDCQLLRSAIAGPGTNEQILNDVLLGRSNADLRAIKLRYQKMYHRDLEKDTLGELSMKTKRQFQMVLAANRPEESAPVIPQQVDSDVTEIYKATEGKVGTDEVMVCSVLSGRSDAQIGAIAYTYQQKFRKELDRVIQSEFSGHMRSALLQQLRTGTDKAMRDAMLLEDAMAGAGTKDHLLTSRIVRFHWDKAHLNNVKGAFRAKYHKDVAQRVKGETSGDYERLLVACLGEH